MNQQSDWAFGSIQFLFLYLSSCFYFSILTFFPFQLLSFVFVHCFSPFLLSRLSFPAFQPSFAAGWCVFSRTFPIIVLQFTAPCLYVSCPVSVCAHAHSSYGHLAARPASQHFLVLCCSVGSSLLTCSALCLGNLPG